MKCFRNIHIRISAMIAAVLLLVAGIPFGTAQAAPNSRAGIDLSRKGRLTITHLSVDDELMASIYTAKYPGIAFLCQGLQYASQLPTLAYAPE